MILLIAWGACSTPADSTTLALNMIYNSFRFYLFVPYLTSPRTTLTWAFDHQRQNFPSCRIVRKYILKYDAKQNYRIRFQYIIALLWSAEMLLNYFQGNTSGTGTRFLLYFTGILMWTQRVWDGATFPSSLFDWMVLIRRYLFPLHKCRSCLWPLKLIMSQARTSGTSLTRDVYPHWRFRLWWVKILHHVGFQSTFFCTENSFRFILGVNWTGNIHFTC